MQPIKFPEVTHTLAPPSGWDVDQRGKCGNLPVWRDHEQFVSCWRPSWRERLVILFGGPVWLSVVSSVGHPPVALRAAKRMFTPAPVEAEPSAWQADNKA